MIRDVEGLAARGEAARLSPASSRRIGPEPKRPKRGYAIMTNGKTELFDEATKVSAKNGEVILDGPDSVDVKLTPEAARETSTRLWDGAAKATGQRKSKKR